MTTLEKIRAEIAEFKDEIAELPNMADAYAAVKHCLVILDKYASEECDRDCEHCTWIECPKEPCEDAVGRQAVMKAIDKWYENNNQLLLNNCIEDLIVDVMELTSVQPKAKTGRWIRLPKNGLSGLPWYECSECEKERCIAMLRDFNYCPNCGAEMKGDTE